MGTIGNKSRTGMVNSPEMRKHISEGMMGHKCGLGNKSRTGQKRSPEEIAKFKETWRIKREQHKQERRQLVKEEKRNNSKSDNLNKPNKPIKEYFISDWHRQRISESKKGKPHPAHDKISAMCKARKGFKHTDEAKRKMSESHKGKPVSPQCLEKATAANTGRVRTGEERDKIRSTLLSKREMLVENGKKAWSDPEKAKVMVGKMRKAKQLHPNKIESIILETLNKHIPDEWNYVGDGSFVIGTKNPDFVRNHGHNQVIEIYGDYWHQGENPQDRIDLFDIYGYKTLVIWESEYKKMTEKQFVDKVIEFMRTANLFYYDPSKR
jgi:hypothetical protein